MQKRFVQVAALLLAFVAILAFVKFQQIQAAIAAASRSRCRPRP